MLTCYVENKNKVRFWFTPKCGCTFIRKLYMYYTNCFINKGNHIETDINDNINFIDILFIRNPYKRIVSGYMDCYVQNEKYIGNFSFNEMLDNLLESEFKNVNKLHFQHQLSENYNQNIKFNKIFDIENIDYEYLDSLFNIKIKGNEQVLNLFRISGHHVKYDKNLYINNAYLLSPTQLNLLYKDNYPYYNSFLNQITIDKINKFYNKDIEFLINNNFNF